MSGAPFPTISISGNPYERGQQYGLQAVTYISHSLAAYREIFEYYTTWQWDVVRTRALDYLPAIGDFRPHIVEEIQGIADGAGVLLADILALNLRTEFLNAAFASQAAHECTSFFTNSTLSADGTRQTILGQNWDWKPSTAKSVIILEVAPDQGPNFVTVVEAGLLAKMGMNASGIGLVTNAMSTDLDQGQSGVPFHIILRAILESDTFDGAVDMMQKMRRASAANYLIADQTGQVLNFEAGPGNGPDNLFVEKVSSGYVHTNHFLCSSLPFVDVGLAQGPDSPIREERMHSFLQEAGNKPGLEGIRSALSDHHNYPFSICCHREEDKPIAEQWVTIASLIMDLPTRTFWLANDNPCQAQYQQLDYGEFLAE